MGETSHLSEIFMTDRKAQINSNDLRKRDDPPETADAGFLHPALNLTTSRRADGDVALRIAEKS